MSTEYTNPSLGEDTIDNNGISFSRYCWIVLISVLIINHDLL